MTHETGAIRRALAEILSAPRPLYRIELGEKLGICRDSARRLLRRCALLDLVQYALRDDLTVEIHPGKALRTGKGVRAEIFLRCHSEGLRPTGYQMLAQVLEDTSPRPAVEIGKTLGISPSSVYRATPVLKKLGFALLVGLSFSWRAPASATARTPGETHESSGDAFDALGARARSALERIAGNNPRHPWLRVSGRQCAAQFRAFCARENIPFERFEAYALWKLEPENLAGAKCPPAVICLRKNLDEFEAQGEAQKKYRAERRKELRAQVLEERAARARALEPVERILPEGLDAYLRTGRLLELGASSSPPAPVTSVHERREPEKAPVTPRRTGPMTAVEIEQALRELESRGGRDPPKA